MLQTGILPIIIIEMITMTMVLRITMVMMTENDSNPSKMLHTGNPPKSVSLQRVMSSMTAIPRLHYSNRKIFHL